MHKNIIKENISIILPGSIDRVSIKHCICMTDLTQAIATMNFRSIKRRGSRQGLADFNHHILPVLDDVISILVVAQAIVFFQLFDGVHTLLHLVVSKILPPLHPPCISSEFLGGQPEEQGDELDGVPFQHGLMTSDELFHRPYGFHIPRGQNDHCYQALLHGSLNQLGKFLSYWEAVFVLVEKTERDALSAGRD